MLLLAVLLLVTVIIIITAAVSQDIRGDDRRRLLDGSGIRVLIRNPTGGVIPRGRAIGSGSQNSDVGGGYNGNA